MNRKTYFFLGAAVVALALITFFYVAGFPPSFGTAGTMASTDTSLAGVERADRYRAGQITAADVELDNPDIQLILQNPDMVTALQNEDFRTALVWLFSNPEGSEAVAKALMDPGSASHQAAASAATDAALAGPIALALSNPAAFQSLMNTLSDALMGPAALNNPAQGQATLNALQAVLSDAAMTAALTTALVGSILNNPTMGALNNPTMGALNNPAEAAALGNALSNVLSDATMTATLTDAVMNALNNPMGALNNPTAN